MNVMKWFMWLLVCAGFLWSGPAWSGDFDEVEIEIVPVSGHVYMLVGRGGNIGLSVGDDGVLMIDDQYAPLTEKILAAIATLTDQPVRFVINTHWHGDHVGGNEHLGEAGAVIVAHDSVRRRMSVDSFMEFFQKDVPAAPHVALPIITFNQSVTFHMNGDEIGVRHLGLAAHTDGDATVWFRDANVVHLGDLFFNGLYPFIDTAVGGSARGILYSLDSVLPILDEETMVIPGHGPLGDKAALAAYRDMLMDVIDRVVELVDQGLTLEEIQAAKPTAAYDDEWGGGFLSPDQFVELVHHEFISHVRELPPDAS